MNIFKLANIDQNQARELMFKIQESIDLDSITEDEHVLIYKLAGADLLDSSTTRALVMLYAKEIIEEYNE